MPDCDDEASKKCKCVTIIIAIILAIVIGIVVSSYADLHYYEMGFAKSQTTGTVDTSKVYTGGRKWLGPTKEFKKFQATSHDVIIDDISVFTSVDKLEIKLGCHLSYFLVKDDLKLLHDEYDVNYHSLMKSSAEAAIKDAANAFTLTQFYEDRENVEQKLHEGVQERLGGICCPESCELTPCIANCKARSTCDSTEKGLYVEARYFQLTSILIPEKVEYRNLAALVLTEETTKEDSIQKAAVIQKETEQLVAEINNQAEELKSEASAQSKLVEANSQANYQKILEGAKVEGLKVMFNRLGMTNESYMNSFNYLKSLSQHQTAHLTIDFDQLILASKGLASDSP